MLGLLVPLAYSKVTPLIKNEMTTFENILRVINFITTPASIGFGIIFVVILGSEILNEFLGLLIGFLPAIAILIINLAVPILINRK